MSRRVVGLVTGKVSGVLHSKETGDGPITRFMGQGAGYTRFGHLVEGREEKSSIEVLWRGGRWPAVVRVGVNFGEERSRGGGERGRGISEGFEQESIPKK